MSFDPYGHQESTLPASGGPSGAPESAGAQQHLAQAMERVKLPGIFLMAIGVLDLLVGLLAAVGFASVAVTSADQLHKTVLDFYMKAEKQNPNHPLVGPAVQELKKQNPQDFKNRALLECGVMGGGLVVAALVVIFGGMRMLQLRSYGLCVLASIVAALPCVSPTCCCGVGGLVGIWSIVVLLTPQVRMMFR
jgi:hypothetical protein